jgi:hypothetical protein
VHASRATRLGSWVVASCRASRGGSLASEIENKDGPSPPNRHDENASLKVFDGVCSIVGEGGWRSTIAFESWYDALAGYG